MMRSIQETKELCKNWENTQASLVAIDGNCMMAAWVLPVSWKPLSFVISIGKTRYTHHLLRVCKNVTIARVLPDKYEEAVAKFGKVSGRDTCKPPIEPYAVPETLCRLKIRSLTDVGDHTLVIASQ